MAFNIAYTYKLIDKFSVPLRKITRLDSQFRAGVKKTSTALGKLSTKHRQASIAAVSSMKKTEGATKKVNRTNTQFRTNMKKMVATGIAFTTIMAASAGTADKLAAKQREGAVATNAATRATEKATREANKFTRATEKAERAVKKKSKTVRGFRGTMNRASAGLSKFSGRMTSFQGVAGAAAAALGGKALLDKFVSFEGAMNIALGTTKATEAEFVILSAKAKLLGATTQFTATQAAMGISMLGRNSLNATQIMNGAIDASLLLSAATGTDLSNSANIATDVMMNFNKTADQLGSIVDRITGTTLNSKFSIDDYRLALGQAGGVAGAVGVSLDDFNTSIAAVSPLFASGSDAGTAFKTFLQRLNPQSKEAASLMKAVGLITKTGGNAFFDSAGKMKGMSEVAETLNKALGGLSDKNKSFVASTVFGTDAMRFAIGLSKVNAASFNTLAGAIEKVSAKKQAENRMRGLGGALKTLASAGESVIIVLFESGLAEILTGIANKATLVARAVSAVNPAILKVVGVVGLLVVILTPLLVIIGFAAAGLSALAGVFAVVSAPVLIVIAVVAAVIGVFAAAYLKSQLLRDSVGFLAESFGPVVKAVKAGISVIGFLSQKFGLAGVGIKVLGAVLSLPFIVLGGVLKALFAPLNFVLNKIIAIVEAVQAAKSIGGAIGGAFKALVFGAPETPEAPTIGAGNIAAREAALRGQLDVNMRVSAEQGSKVESVKTKTTLPGNLGMNLAGSH